MPGRRRTAPSSEAVYVDLLVAGVQEVMRLLAALSASLAVEEGIVEFLDLGVQVRHAERALLVIGVEAGRALRAHLVRRKAGLSAAADAAAAARHDLDEVVARLDAVLPVLADLVQHLLDVAHLVRDGDVDLRALDVNGRCLDAIHATHLLEVDAGRLGFAGDEAIGRAEGGLHDAAGDAEDRACAGISAEQLVGRLLGERREVDACRLDHAGKLAGRKHNVRILEAGRVHVLVADDLVLLGRAGHDRSDMHLGGVDAVLLGPVALAESGLHLLRRFRGREVLGEVGSVLLHPVGPRGAAAGEERERAALGEALDELGALLHDRDVGGEVSVEHLVEAETAERGIDLAGSERAGLHAKGFAERDADGRGDLHEADLLGILQRGPDLLRLVVLVDGAHGAVRGALAALDAGRLGELDAGGRGHDRLLAAADELKRPDVLHLLAHLGAAAALDALVGVEHDGRRGVVDVAVNDLARERYVANAEVGCDRLQFAGAGARALQAVLRVVCEDKLQDGAAHLHDVGIVGDDLHPGHRLGAARAEKLRAGHELAVVGRVAARHELPHDADAAAGAGLQVRVVAQRGYLDVGGPRRHEKVGALRHADRDAVDLKRNHFGFHCLKPFSLSRGISRRTCRSPRRRRTSRTSPGR